MKKSFFLAVLFLISGWAVAQKVELTLEDAVLKRFTTYYPEYVHNLQWIPETGEYSYVSKDGDKLMRSPVRGKASVFVDLKGLNAATGAHLNRISDVTWLNNHTIVFNDGGTYYEYDMLKQGNGKILITPDGAANANYHTKSNQLAYTKGNNLFMVNGMGQEIAVTNYKDPNIVSGQAIARSEYGITGGIFWSPEGNYLAFYQKDESDVADYPLLDITTTPGSLETIKYPMAGQGSERAKVGVYNVRTQKVVYLKVTGEPNQYLTNLGWGPKEKYVYIAVINRATDHFWLNKYRAKDGKFIKTLFEETNKKYVEPEQPVRFLPGSDKEFLWFSKRDGFNHIYHYNTKGKYLGQLSAGKWCAISILGLDAGKNNLIFYGTDESGMNRYAYKTNLKTGKVTRISKNPGMHRFKLSKNGKYLIDTYSTLKTPRVTNIIDLDGNILQNILTASDPLANVKIGTVEFHDIKANDGTILHTRMIKPSNFDPKKKYPVLVYLYGGPHLQLINNSWMGGVPLWMLYQAEKGYIVFSLDNRGSAARGLAFENIIHRQLGTVEMEDQLAGVNYLKSLPFVDGNRMAVHGWSFGGFMTTSLMLRKPGTFQVGVAGGPVTDWKYYEVMYGERYMDTPQENPEGYDKARLHNYVSNLQGKLLLIHGTTDKTVVMQHNLTLIDAFIKAGKQVDFFPYPMHEHNVYGRDRVHLMTKILGYIDDALGVNAN